MPEAITGSCLCGGVRYALHPPVRFLGHCHCSRCRKFHGAAMGTEAIVLREQFRLTSGADLLHTYSKHPYQDRTFCIVCGSSLFGGWGETDVIRICAGTLDDDPIVRPMLHNGTETRAPWFEITDDVPQLTRADWDNQEGNLS